MTKKITDKEAAQARALLDRYASQQQEKLKRKTIPCASCDKRHQIGKLDAIATHWYVKPSGCTDGDYWVEGDFHFVCPDTGIRNRLYFWDDYDSRKAGVDASEAFKKKYRTTFKSVTPAHEHDPIFGGTSYRWVNNDYIDKNREAWGLPRWAPSKIVPGRT